jgi:hypothetical protein
MRMMSSTMTTPASSGNRACRGIAFSIPAMLGDVGDGLGGCGGW